MRTKQNTNLTIHIKDFGDDVGYSDKISLKYKWEEGAFNRREVWYEHQLKPNSSKKIIQRRVCDVPSLNCRAWQDAVVVEGARQNEITEEAVIARRSQIFELRQ